MKRRLWLVRHGETDWSAAGKHTGRTDVPLNERGREQARALGRGLAALGVKFAASYVSPLGRARETAALAGFPDAEALPDLREWDYGEFEGRKTADIRRETNDPEWLIWTADIREGESPAAVGARCDRVGDRLAAGAGDVILFAHGHFLRMFAARWLALAAVAGQHLALDPGTVSILGYEHEYRVIARWNAPLAADGNGSKT
ncbi:MAG TPA: histidine phosphatase family protein [Gammaproteobacteria bacterium]|nr:histidine phosphatase family protein [Gammaproteobacteria bacterium]